MRHLVRAGYKRGTLVLAVPEIRRSGRLVGRSVGDKSDRARETKSGSSVRTPSCRSLPRISAQVSKGVLARRAKFEGLSGSSSDCPRAASFGHRRKGSEVVNPFSRANRVRPEAATPYRRDGRSPPGAQLPPVHSSPLERAFLTDLNKNEFRLFLRRVTVNRWRTSRLIGLYVVPQR